MIFTQTELTILDEDTDPTDLVNGDKLPSAKTGKVDRFPSEDEPLMPDKDCELPDSEAMQDPKYQAAYGNYLQALSEWEGHKIDVSLKHRLKINELSDQLVKLDKEIENQSDVLKSLKSQRKDTLLQLMELEQNGPGYLPKPQAPKVEKTTNKKGETVIKIFTPEVDDTEWREIPLSKVFPETLEGFGKKKRSLLFETYQTLGQLEDLRAEASKEHMHFSEKLPKGFGINLADKMEDCMTEAILNAMSKTPIE